MNSHLGIIANDAETMATAGVTFISRSYRTIRGGLGGSTTSQSHRRARRQSCVRLSDADPQALNEFTIEMSKDAALGVINLIEESRVECLWHMN